MFSKFKGGIQITELYFKVKPDSDRFEVNTSQIPVIKLTEKPENGRANAELLHRLEEITGERPGILSGHSSRRKKLVFDQEKQEIREKLEQNSEK